MGSDKQSGSPRPLLGTLKMGRVRTILTHTYPYPHEHSRHIMTAVIIACLFFISSDNMHTLIHKLDNNIKWWSMYVCLIGFFYFFSSPFLGRTIQPSYSNFNRWYVLHFRLLHNSVLISLVGLVPVDHRSSMLIVRHTTHMVILHDCRYVAWICFASLYHLPSFQSMGVDIRMNLSLFLTIYFSSVLFIIALMSIFVFVFFPPYCSNSPMKTDLLHLF